MLQTLKIQLKPRFVPYTLLLSHDSKLTACALVNAEYHSQQERNTVSALCLKKWTPVVGVPAMMQVITKTSRLFLEDEHIHLGRVKLRLINYNNEASFMKYMHSGRQDDVTNILNEKPNKDKCCMPAYVEYLHL